MTHRSHFRPPRAAVAIVVALLAAASTWAVGWWVIAALAFVAGWLLRDLPGVAGTTALGASLGWALLLGVDALGGRLPAMAGVLGGLFRMPAAAVVVATLVLPALLAWSAAVLGSTLAE